MNKDDYQKQKNKLFVSELINQVITGKISVLQALTIFPRHDNDTDLKCAFDALMHREADEDLRNKITDYAQTQDEYLTDIAELLRNNEKLPENIIKQYNHYHKDNLIFYSKNKWKNIVNYIKRMINF